MNLKIDLDKSQYATLETSIEKELERTQAHESRR
jgi:hypothetical protein